MEILYPIFLKLTQTPCLVVGGGRVATRKVDRLIQSGARVTVISPTVSQELADLADQGKLTLIEREARPADVAGFSLVFCTADDPEVNRVLAQAALEEGAQVNVADAPELSSFYLPALVNKGKLQIAISTSGASPALAKQLRLDLEKHLGKEYELALEVEDYLRELILKNFPPQKRTELFRELASALPDICGSAQSPQEVTEALAKYFDFHLGKEFEQLITPYFR